LCFMLRIIYLNSEGLPRRHIQLSLLNLARSLKAQYCFLEKYVLNITWYLKTLHLQSMNTEPNNLFVSRLIENLKFYMHL
jgi:hypothetical protein